MKTKLQSQPFDWTKNVKRWCRRLMLDRRRLDITKCSISIFFFDGYKQFL
jgi:hypothetical protein